MMVKGFMLSYVIPQLLKDGNRKSLYIEDPLRAAVITLHVWTQHHISLANSELHQLCTALCLPKLEKDTFLQYWAEFSQDVSILRWLPNLFNNPGIIHSSALRLLILLFVFVLIIQFLFK